MRKDGFTVCAKHYIKCLRQEGRYATAHVYESALRSFTMFCGTAGVSFRQITRGNLKRYSSYLMDCHLRLNTISTYMRMLRCIYNRGVDMHQTPYVHRMFRDVFTGIDTRQKKAIPINELHTLLNEDPQSDKLRRTQAIANLLFLFCGMPFVDLAYLRKSDLHDNVITYRRRKTGRPLSVTLTPEAMAILKRYMNRDSSSPYLFPLLNSREGTKEAYHEYQLALRNFNRQLMLLGEMLGLGDKLSSYTARHTWATTAYYCEIHPGVISEAMGHSSITVTETYLKPFRNKKIDEANKKVVDFIKRSMSFAIY